jgi:sugar lactone lactonase YvrE
MKKSIIVITLALLFPTFFAVAQADSDGLPIVRPFAAIPFAKLPSDLRFPEGITANPYNGDIYVATFAGGATNGILRFDRHGRLEARNDFAGPTPLLGLAFNPRDYKVYITSVGDFVGSESKIQRIDANFTSATSVKDVAVIPGIGAPDDLTVGNPDGSNDVIDFGDGARVPNALTFDQEGNLFVSDSFQGAIFRIADPTVPGNICPFDSGCVRTIAHDGRLATAGFPPFGANGIAFKRHDSSVLFVANTGDDTILRLDLSGLDLLDPSDILQSGDIAIFAQSINGADGIAFDSHGRLWVVANQGDRIVMVNDKGRVDAQLGGFFGIGRKGTPVGLSFPASIAIVGDNMFVTNLGLPLTPTAGDEWEEKVTRYTVSRIRMPSFHHHHHHH